MDKFLYGVIVLAILMYLGISIVLNKLNKVIYKKSTVMAFLPIFNFYLLGKLTVNKIVGWLLVIATLITSSFIVSINGSESTYTILPNSTSAFISAITSVMIIFLFIFAIIKYNKIKDRKFKEKVLEETDDDIKDDKSDLLDNLNEVKEIKKTFIQFLEEETNVIHPLLQDKNNDEFIIPDANEINKKENIKENNIHELANNCNNMINSLTNDITCNNDVVENNNFDDFFEEKTEKDINVEEHIIPCEEVKIIPQEDDIGIFNNNEKIDNMESISINNDSFEDNNDDFIPDMIN